MGECGLKPRRDQYQKIDDSVWNLRHNYGTNLYVILTKFLVIKTVYSGKKSIRNYFLLNFFKYLSLSLLLLTKKFREHKPHFPNYYYWLLSVQDDKDNKYIREVLVVVNNFHTIRLGYVSKSPYSCTSRLVRAVRPAKVSVYMLLMALVYTETLTR